MKGNREEKRNEDIHVEENVIVSSEINRIIRNKNL